MFFAFSHVIYTAYGYTWAIKFSGFQSAWAQVQLEHIQANDKKNNHAVERKRQEQWQAVMKAELSLESVKRPT